MTIGPVMVDIKGTTLLPEEVERIAHPLVGGLILFTRNYESPKQLSALIHSIRKIKSDPLLIAVDHEGGRVQRFRDGFTRLPAMRELGRLWDNDKTQARNLCEKIGYVLGAELRAYDIDFSFTPVLDLDFGESSVIGDRAFHQDTEVVSELAYRLLRGLQEAGMATVGKHYPGHGYVKGDSHTEIPIDNRTLTDIRMADLLPFERMIHYGMTAVMPAHVIYPKVDAKPAGFSKIWLQKILREELRFEGVIFSDDLSMEGASTEGDIVARGYAALEAGCDMVLVCNDPKAADQLLASLEWDISPASVVRLLRMRGAPHPKSITSLRHDDIYTAAIKSIENFADIQPQLALGPDPTSRDG